MAPCPLVQKESDENTCIDASKVKSLGVTDIWTSV